MDLTMAFLKAHARNHRGHQETPIAELRDGYDASADAGRQFLRALGITISAEQVVSASWTEVIDHSAVIRALLAKPPETSKHLHREVVAALTPHYPPFNKLCENERRKAASTRQIVESARGVAYLVMVADAARAALPKAGRRGPPPSAFKTVLLRELTKCYCGMFGRWPTLSRGSEGENPSGPALEWLRRVLALALKRCPPTELETGVEDHSSAAIAPPRVLLDELEELDRILPQTLGRHFEKAIRQVRPSKARLREFWADQAKTPTITGEEAGR
jgi:hypothetical protein